VHKLRGVLHAASERTTALNASMSILEGERNRVLAEDTNLRKEQEHLKSLEHHESQVLLELRAKNHEFSQQADRLKSLAETENRALQVQMERLNSQAEAAEAAKATIRVLTARNQEKNAKEAEARALLLVETQKKTMMQNEIDALRAENQKKTAKLSALVEQNESAAVEIKALRAQSQSEIEREHAMAIELGALHAEKEQMTANFISQRMRTVLDEIDPEDEGIGREEFHELLMRADAMRFLTKVGVDVVALVDLVEHLYKESAKVYDKGELIALLMQLRGHNNSTVKDIVDLRQYLDGALCEVKDHIIQLAAYNAKFCPDFFSEAPSDYGQEKKEYVGSVLESQQSGIKRLTGTRV